MSKGVLVAIPQVDMKNKEVQPDDILASFR
jgi:hypothetical protein